jgi:hypothetical protein
VSHVTCPLNALARRDPVAAAELLPPVYDDLRRLAAYRLGHEVPGRTPQPTAFGHEAYSCLPRGQPKKQRHILGDDLEIIPAFMRYEPHAELEFAPEAGDQAAAAPWLDDRIVDFVPTYLPMGESEIYTRDRMVEDPIASSGSRTSPPAPAWSGRARSSPSSARRRAASSPRRTRLPSSNKGRQLTKRTWAGRPEFDCPAVTPKRPTVCLRRCRFVRRGQAAAEALVRPSAKEAVMRTLMAVVALAVGMSVYATRTALQRN